MRIGRLKTGQKVSKDWLLRHGWVSAGSFVGVGSFGVEIDSFEKPSKAKNRVVKGEKRTYIPILEMNVRTGRIALLGTRIIFHDLKRVSKS
jgi:hypothetical protein